VVVPVNLSFVRALAHPGYPGLKGRKTVLCLCIKKNVLLPMPTILVDVGRIFEAVCLFVCFAAAYGNSETNDLKVFELVVANDLGIYSEWYAFRIKRSKVKVKGQ